MAERLSEANKNEFYYHAGKSVCRLYLDEIHYFACNGRKVEIYTSSGQKEFYGAMREVWEQVEGKGFWIGKWSIASVLFKTVADSRRYLIVASISVSLFFVFEMILEKAGKSRQERERELLEQEIRIYENQFGIIRQSQHNIRALKHDMKHHIKMLTDMVSGGETEEALKYLASMGGIYGEQRGICRHRERKD
ncbi:hypothetical protein AALB53_05260 [Lachnospiraceae bacterium 47-T17]